jgi:apolipoprotein N-acyltransferase
MPDSRERTASSLDLRIVTGPKSHYPSPALPTEPLPLERSLAHFSVRLLLAALSGVLLAIAFPDYSIAWLAFVAVVPLLVALVHTRGAWESFLLGWISQSVAWLIMVPWVVRVMSYYGGLPYAMGVLIFCAMSLYLGLYGGVFALAVRLIAPRERFLRWLLVPLAWAAVEFARTRLLSGFPWNLLAASIVDYAPLIQIARAAGPYLLGCLILLPTIVIAWLLTQRSEAVTKVIALGLVASVIFVWWGTGYVAERWRTTRDTGEQTFTAALLQPNITQQMRWNESEALAIYRQMIGMTLEAAQHGANVVIWPESTVPFEYANTGFFRDSVESMSRDRGIDIILGTVAEDPSNPNRVWNTAFLVSGGRTTGRYDKIHLVPFGEYVPMRRMLFFAKKLVHAVGEFEFGTNDYPLRGMTEYGPAICYEVVFPQITRTQVRHGAGVLVTITNDAWYDGTSAPRQHLNMARMRAVEDDRDLLRAATTGISAFVDRTGRVVEEIPMGREGIVYAKFATRHTETPYVRFGDWFAWMAVALVLLAIAMRKRGAPGA